jgi:hypothetical protein
MIDPHNSDNADHLAALEDILHASEPALDAARSELRMWLFTQIHDDKPTGSIGDALLTLARLQTGNAKAASVIIRALSVPDLLPKSNDINHIMRSCVELCERSLPFFMHISEDSYKGTNVRKISDSLRGAFPNL